MTSIAIWLKHTDRVELGQPALLLIVFIIVQATLGALTVLSRRDPWINSLHVVGGAIVLTTSLVISLRTWRAKFDRIEPLRRDRARSAQSALDGPVRPVGGDPQSARIPANLDVDLGTTAQRGGA